MKQIDRRAALALAFAACGLVFGGPAWADEYSDAVATFHKADESGKFFQTAYGYAVFPKIGKAGVGIGGAHGKGRVYEKGNYIGDTTMNQLSLGAQLGAEGYSQMIFFENQAALKKFTAGNFEFAAGMQAVVITAGAGAKAGTAGATAGASVEKETAKVAAPAYHDGTAVFTIIRGGLMYEVSLAGQKYKYQPKAQTKP